MGLSPSGASTQDILYCEWFDDATWRSTWRPLVVFGAFDRPQRIDLYYRDSNPAHEAEVVSRTGAVKHGIPNAVEAGPPLRRRGGDRLRGDLLPLLRRTANRARGERGWRGVVSPRGGATSLGKTAPAPRGGCSCPTSPPANERRETSS